MDEGPGEVVTPLESPYAFNGISSPAGERPSSGMGTRGMSGSGKGTGAGMGKKAAEAFPPPRWGRRKSGGSYFSQAGATHGDAYDDHDDINGLSGAMGKTSVSGGTRTRGTYDNGLGSANSDSWDYDRPPKISAEDDSSTSRFGEHFESDFTPPATQAGRSSYTGSTNSSGGGGSTKQRFADWQPEHHPQSKSMGAFEKRTFSPSPTSSLGINRQRSSSNPYGAPQSKLAQRSPLYDESAGSALGTGGSIGGRSSIYGGSANRRKKPEFDGFRDDDEIDDPFSSPSRDDDWGSGGGKKKIEPNRELMKPLARDEGVARAIALFDFKAVEVRSYSTAVHRLCLLITSPYSTRRETFHSRKDRSSQLRRRVILPIRGGRERWMESKVPSLQTLSRWYNAP